MKKAIVILLAAIMAVSFLAACSGSSTDSGYSGGGTSSYSMSAPQAAPYDSGGTLYNYMSDSDYDYPEEAAYYDGESGGSIPAPAAPAPSSAPMPGNNSTETATNMPDTSGSGQTADSGAIAEKIIYTAYADIETVDFDDTIEKVNDLLGFNNAFIENSYIGGRNYAQSYYGYQTYRSANFTLRIPKDRFRTVTDSLDVLGNVTSLQTNAENITAQFVDTESRLTSYRIQEERLLAMLEKADNVTDMISIESRLAEVRYSIESITSTLKNWQSQVDYSTLTLYISEVVNFTETIPIQRTYWQQVGDGLQSTTRSVGRFFTDLFKWVIVNLPVLAILAVIVVVVVILVRRKIRKRRDSSE